MRNEQTKKLTLTAMFIAIELLLFMVPFLGFIPIGPINATTLHIPVIIAGIILGKNRGALLGLVFGIASITNATINVTPGSFLFSPFVSGNLMSAFIAIVPRMTLGYIAGYLFELAQKVKPDFAFNIPAVALASSFIHSVFVLGSIYVLYGQAYASLYNVSLDALLPIIFGILATNSVIEAILGSVLATLVCRPILKYLRK
ncbi:MAG: ECF transporter S component [Erysipelotrichaceae bacterium]|nr:ECF transporter S component [Erysipelotrichaceae bacterium]MDD3808680.1 ECF transporter S component [Erysipelotrichaceae bacterium]